MTWRALRFYEKEGLLIPASVDPHTGYRFYETSQFAPAARIKAYRQLGLSIDEIGDILNGEDARRIFTEKVGALRAEKEEIDIRLSIINHILEDEEMRYQVTEKMIPAMIVYYSETVLNKYSDVMIWIPEQGAECMALNPNLKCTEPPYNNSIYHDIYLGQWDYESIRLIRADRYLENAYKQGFIKRYPDEKTDIMGVMGELWHYRYVGKYVSY